MDDFQFLVLRGIQGSPQWLQLPNPHNAPIGQLEPVQSTLNEYSVITI